MVKQKQLKKTQMNKTKQNQKKKSILNPPQKKTHTLYKMNNNKQTDKQNKSNINTKQ